MEEFAGSLGEQSLLDVLRRAFLRRQSGTLEVEGPGGEGHRVLRLRAGELELAADHPLLHLGPPTGDEDRPRIDRELVEHLAGVLDGVRGGSFRTSEPADLPGGAEPCSLPTAQILMAGASRELKEGALLEEMGGEGARWQVVKDESARQRVAGLEAGQMTLLRRLEHPLSVGELLREQTGRREEALRRLIGLQAIGLIRKVDTGPVRTPGGEEVSRKLVHHFARRVEKQLARRPVAMPVEQHRQKVAELLSVVGGMNHYEVLGIDPVSDTHAIQKAFEEMARWVHPSHAKALQLEGRAGVLGMLFQRAVAAYVTLTDPERRGHYDWQMEVVGAPKKSEEQLHRERRGLARQKYREAVHRVANEDFHFAVELLLQSVQLQPSADALSLLAEVETRNPHWRNRAATHYREAIELSPDDAQLRVDLARLLAEDDRLAEAQLVLAKTLERFPAHAGALDLSVSLERTSRGSRGLGKLFGRDQD